MENLTSLERIEYCITNACDESVSDEQKEIFFIEAIQIYEDLNIQFNNKYISQQIDDLVKLAKFQSKVLRKHYHAINNYISAIDKYKILIPDDPINCFMKLMILYAEVGEIQSSNIEDIVNAEISYLNLIVYAKRLLAADKNEYFGELGFYSYKLGLLQQNLKKYEDSESNLTMAIDVYSTFLIQYNKNSCYILAQAYFHRGALRLNNLKKYKDGKTDLDNAVKYYLETVKHLESLPENFEYYRYIAYSYFEAGQIKSYLREYRSSLMYYKKAFELFTELMKSAPDLKMQVVLVCEYICRLGYQFEKVDKVVGFAKRAYSLCQDGNLTVNMSDIIGGSLKILNLKIAGFQVGVNLDFQATINLNEIDWSFIEEFPIEGGEIEGDEIENFFGLFQSE